jgi:hypothetical protein
MMDQQGFVKLKAPLPTTDVWLSNGRKVTPDNAGTIVVNMAEAAPLLGAGWQVIQPLPSK